MSENWAADARVGVPMFQVIAKQVSQHKHRPRTVRQIIDQQWLDEESKQQLREIFQVTDADLVRQEHEAAEEARRRTRERYGIPVPAGPCQCDAEPVVDPSGRIECGNCGAEWAAPEVRQVIDTQWLDEASKQQLREGFHVTDADLSVLGRSDGPADRPACPGPEPPARLTAPPTPAPEPPARLTTPPTPAPEPPVRLTAPLAPAAEPPVRLTARLAPAAEPPARLTALARMAILMTTLRRRHRAITRQLPTPCAPCSPGISSTSGCPLYSWYLPR
jgi:hypothetical protein